MNTDASVGWSFVCILPVLLLAVSSVILVVVLVARAVGKIPRTARVSRPLKRALAFGVPAVLFVLGVLGTASLAEQHHRPSPLVVAAPLILGIVVAVVCTLLYTRWAFPEWWAHRQKLMFPDRLGHQPADWWRQLLSVFAFILSGIGLLGVLFAARVGHPYDETGVLSLFALIAGGVLLLVALPKVAPTPAGQKPVSFWRFVFSKTGALIFLGGVGVAIAVAVVTGKHELAKLVGNAFIIGMVWWKWSRYKAEASTPATADGPLVVAPLLLTPDPTRVAGDCPTCLYPIPADSPHGLCPRCLIRGAMPSPSSTRLHRGVSPIEPPTAAEVNDFFPNLEVLELIGAGGMGAVYTARQPALDRVVALKIVQSPRGDDDPVFAERFAREARAMAKLDHPNIVTIHESGEAGGLPFLLMEYIDGVTLREAMVNRLLTTTEALAVIPQVCDALDFAHRNGVVHRDIKPENILIDQTGRVKIADFGLAKLADPKNVTLTRTQQAMGTPHYMAPEQWERPNDVDHRADIYALGVVLYELLTGELPLAGSHCPQRRGRGTPASIRWW